MKSIGIIGNYEKDGVFDAVGRIAGFFCGRGRKVLVDESLRGRVESCAGAEFADADSVLEAEAVFVLGGDGTVLGVARRAALKERPPLLLCINMGSLGFLAQNRREDMDALLRACIDGGLSDCGHSLVELSLPGGEPRTCLAMNEVVFGGCGGLSRAIDIELLIDGRPVADYLCDGLIAATPSGLTAHSLSAGGPIMAPGTDALLVTPICPFTMSNRPLIVPGRSLLGLRSKRRTGITVDGQEYFDLPAGQEARVRLYPRGVRLAHAGGQSFFDLLRIKLNWRGNVLGGLRHETGEADL